MIWGPPGTGKSWIARMIATSACAAGLRTRWTSFPVLYDQLLRLYRNTDGQTLDSKLMYYSRFDLLCIDEFPNVSEMDPFLVQQMFNTFSERGHSILLCMQCHAMPTGEDGGAVLDNKHRPVHKRTNPSEGKEASSLRS